MRSDKLVLCAKLDAVQQQHTELVSLVNYRPKKRNVSTIGAYNLVRLRQNGQISATALVAVAGGASFQGQL